MLRERYTREQVEQLLVGKDQWRPFPPASDRAAWDAVAGQPANQARRADMIAQADGLSGKDWPFLPASSYMAFWRNGDRRIYEKPYFLRRQNLAKLVMAECLEYKGRFLDEIINGLWAICEETSWAVPAHSYMKDVADTHDLLPRRDRHIVDLFAAQTAMAVAEASYLLGDELDAVTKIVRQRIDELIETRIVDPVMDYADFQWLSIPMNWNPWCSSNVLGAAYYVLDDPTKVADLTWQLMGSTDKFLHGQLPDGGCSEGPNYWGVAPGALVNLLELLHSRSNGQISVYDEPLIADLGRYFSRVHLDGPWFATFADCPPVVFFRREKVYRYGERVGDDSMRNLVLLSRQGWARQATPEIVFDADKTGGTMMTLLRDLFWIPADASASEATKPIHTWLPDLQVMVARTDPAFGQGLVLAAKGGHNQEHHNHNDVGQFILVSDGEPVIADVGVGIYTRDTFNENRYKNWSIRGAGHNIPVINGVEQREGGQYRASDVSCEQGDDVSEFRLNLATAYSAEAGVKAVWRTIRLDRKTQSMMFADSIEFEADAGSTELHMFTPAEFVIAEPGRAELRLSEQTLTMIYDPAACEVRSEPWPITDRRLAEAWGDQLTRLTLKASTADGRCEYAVTFRKG